MKSAGLCCAVVVTAAAVLAVPQNVSAPVSIEDLMSASEFRQAGLGKLSAQELAFLSNWLGKYATVVSAASRKADSVPSTSTVIESHIDGDFNGWEGETIFKLDNGQ